MPSKKAKPRKDPYETLGVGKEASTDAIKKAWRKKAKESHPDRNKDADPQEIRDVNQAYEVLANPLKRAKYDRGEDVEETTDEEAQIRQIIIIQLNTIIMFTDPEVAKQHKVQKVNHKREDMLEIMKKSIAISLMSKNSELLVMKGELRIVKEIRERLSAKEKCDGFLIMALDRKVQEKEAIVANQEQNIEHHKSAALRLDTYQYKTDIDLRASFDDYAKRLNSAGWN